MEKYGDLKIFIIKINIAFIMSRASKFTTKMAVIFNPIFAQRLPAYMAIISLLKIINILACHAYRFYIFD